MSHCSHSAGIRPASSGWKNLLFAMKEKTRALQWKSSGINLRNHRAAFWLPGQVNVGFKAVGRSCSNRKGFSALYFFFSALYFFSALCFFSPCISFFLPSISFLLIPRRRNAPPQFGRRGGVPAEEAKIS